MTYVTRNPNGQTTMANSAPVVVASDQASIPVSIVQKARISTEFTRPADTNAYSIGDVVSNDTTTTTLIDLSGVASANAGGGYIVGIQLSTDKKSITPRFRVHFYNASNPTIAADNVAHKELYTDIAKKIGYIDLPAMTTPSDTTSSTVSKSYSGAERLPFITGASSTHLYAVIEALDAFTPASAEKFTLDIIVER